MWIEELDVLGFGRLRGRFRFARGLTVVTGDNEAGKSTLHAGLVRALSGFSRTEQRRSRGGPSPKDGRHPWVGDAFGLNALLHGANGRSLRVEWDFREHVLRLRDGDTGEDLTAEVPVSRGEVRLGRYLLGVDRAEFRDVCCLDQTTIEGVRRTEDLELALQRAVETSAAGAGVDGAVRLLNEFLRVEVGVHSGHFHDLPRGRLATLRRERASLAGELERCERDREQVESLAAELAEREFALGVLRRAALETEQRLLLADLTELESRLEQAHRLERRARDLPPHPVRLSEPAVAKARQLLGDVDRLQVRVGRLEERVAEGASRLRELEARRRELTTRADALEVYAATDHRAEAQVLDLRGRRAALSSVRVPGEAPLLPDPDPALSRYRLGRPGIVELELEIAAVGWSGGKLAAALAAGAVALATLGWGLGVVPRAAKLGIEAPLVPMLGVGSPLLPMLAAGLLALAAGVLFYLARPEARRGPLRRRRAEAFRAYGAGSLGEMDARVQDEDHRLAVARAGERAHDEQVVASREQALAVEAEIGRLLDQAEAPPLPSLDERMAAYLTACRRQGEGVGFNAEVERLRGEILLAGRPLDELREVRGELEGRRAQLAQAYAVLTIDAAEAARARENFLFLVARAEADAERLREAQHAAATLRELLGGEGLEDLSHRAGEAGQRVEAHVARHGRLAAAAGDRGTLDAERGHMQEEAQKAEIAVAEIRVRIRMRETVLADPAELKEGLAEVEGRLATLEHASRALRMAREELERAAREAHRLFAPRLNAALRQNLPTLTGGRYAEAVVDSDLRIQVRAPETGRFVPVSTLSRGTQDQIYLLQRLELVRMLDRLPGELPLLLEDPFVHFDENRLRGALGVLREVAAERQVFLFTEDSQLVRHASDVCPDCVTIALPPPPSALARAPVAEERDGVGLQAAEAAHLP